MAAKEAAEGKLSDAEAAEAAKEAAEGKLSDPKAAKEEAEGKLSNLNILRPSFSIRT